MQTFCYTRHKDIEKLIDFLVRRFPYQDEENWMKAIRSGAIKVNGRQVSPGKTLKSRDVISYERPRSQEPEVDARYSIIYLDPHILGVEKSGNLPIAESGRYYRNTLINILKEKEGYPELYQVHRLDKETSGVILIARTKEVAAQLGNQFVKGIPKKVYHAMLTGEMGDEEVMVDRPIKKCRPDQSRIRIRQVIDDAGKPSRTLFNRVAKGDGLTLAEVRTFTGRTHQIRCHAEHIGHPILGDKLYGQTDDDFLAFLNNDRKPVFGRYGKLDHQLLHASSLGFTHPVTGQEMQFSSDYREEFSRFEMIRNWLDLIEIR